MKATNLSFKDCVDGFEGLVSLLTYSWALGYPVIICVKVLKIFNQ